MPRSSSLWLTLHLGLGLGLGLAWPGLTWIALLVSQAPAASGIGATRLQVLEMLVVAGWLPSLALACWPVCHRRWRDLLISDLLAASVLVLLAFSLYLPLFIFNAASFLPLALLPRGVLSERLVRSLPIRAA